MTTTERIEVVAVRPTASNLTDPDRWVNDYGGHLFGFAFNRLHNAAAAEDAVQETFLAALKSEKSFAGTSTEKTWLTGILKNKIIDHFRKSTRHANFSDLNGSQTEEDGSLVDTLMQQAGLDDCAPWAQMGNRLDHGRFWEIYDGQAAKLPVKMAKAFHLREVEGTETGHICSRLGISESNLWVTIHRAKVALRAAFSNSEFA